MLAVKATGGSTRCTRWVAYPSAADQADTTRGLLDFHFEISSLRRVTIILLLLSFSLVAVNCFEILKPSFLFYIELRVISN